MSEQAAVSSSTKKKSGGGSYRCDQCGKSFARKFNLKRHQKQGGCHLKSGGGSYRCDQCGKSFARKFNLKRHQKQGGCHLKSGGGSYRCDQCDKSFVRKFSLERHLKQGGCHLVCQHCQKVLKTKNGLEKHIQSAHYNAFERDFACELCFKNFTSNDSRQAHLSEDHIENLSYKVVTRQYRGKHMVFRKFFTGKNAQRSDLLLKNDQQEQMFEVLYAMLLKHPHIKWNMNTHLLLSKLDEVGEFQGKRDYHIPSPIRHSWPDRQLVVRQIREAGQQLMSRLDDLETEGSGFAFVAYVKNDINVYSLVV